MGLRSSKPADDDRDPFEGIVDHKAIEIYKAVQVKEAVNRLPPPIYATADDIQYRPTGGIRFKVHDVKEKIYDGPFVSTEDVDDDPKVGKTLFAGKPKEEKNSLRKSWSSMGKVAFVSSISPDKNDSPNTNADQGSENTEPTAPKSFKPPLKVVETFTRFNMFAYCVYESFFKHYPLRLTPDIIWITILQGLVIHVNQNVEELRHKFVEFEGKETVTISRPEVCASAIQHAIDTHTNGTVPWEDTITEFVNKMKSRMKPEIHMLTDCDFSTTTPMDRIAKQVVAMELSLNYFKAYFMCGCGFPSIELAGTPDDWKLLRSKAQTFSEYGLDWWLKYLIPVLDEFVDASEGKVNLTFWRACVYHAGGSGLFYTPYTGWIQSLFPYLLRETFLTTYYCKNESLGCWMEDDMCETKPDFIPTRAFNELKEDEPPPRKVESNGNSYEVFPSGINKAPFKLMDISTNEELDMVYAAGIVAMTYDEETHAMEVKTGYAVLDTSAKKEKTKEKSKKANKKSWFF